MNEWTAICIEYDDMMLHLTGQATMVESLCRFALMTSSVLKAQTTEIERVVSTTPIVHTLMAQSIISPRK